MIQVICAQCGLKIMVPPTVQGREGVCFACGNPLHVPVNTDPSERVQSIDFEPGTRVAERYIIDTSAVTASKPDASRERVWLDADPGMGVPGSDIDDGLAILLLLASPELPLSTS